MQRPDDGTADGRQSGTARSRRGVLAGLAGGAATAVAGPAAARESTTSPAAGAGDGTAAAGHGPPGAGWDAFFGGDARNQGLSDVIRGYEPGTYVAVGRTFGGGQDAYVVKFDGAGTRRWRRRPGGNDEDFLASLVRVPGAGDYAAVGYTESGVADGTRRRWVVRFDPDGTVTDRTRRDGDVGPAQFDRVAPAGPEGEAGFVAVGRTVPGDGTDDAIVQRFDAGGDPQWLTQVVESEAERFLGVAPTGDGGAVAAGYTEVRSKVDAAERRAWLNRLDPEFGAVRWRRVLGPTAAGARSQCNGVAPVGDGFVAVGQVEEGGDPAGYAVRVGADGSVEWTTRDPAGGGDGRRQFWDVQAAPDGESVLLAGYDDALGEVTSLDAGTGDRNWRVADGNRADDATDRLFGLTLTPGGDCVPVGEYAAGGDYDAWARRLRTGFDLARFDRNADGRIDAGELLDAVAAHRTGATVAGRPVAARDVLRAVAAFNAGGAV